MVRLMVVLLLVVAAGCSDSGPSGPRPVEVKGRVSMDGAPVAHGRILFAQSESDPTPVETAISNGAFSLHLVPGTKKVVIYAYKSKKLPKSDKQIPDPKTNVAPERYNKKTQLTADIDSGRDNDLEYKLSSK